MNIQFFRYGATGAGNLVFDWILYFIIYNFVLQKQMLNLGIVTLSSHIATKFIEFPVIFMSGFMLQKYVTFTDSTNRGHEQIFRYLLIAFINIGLNYAGLKLFFDVLHVYASISNVIVTILITVFSYFSQKKFTFKTQ